MALSGFLLYIRPFSDAYFFSLSGVDCVPEFLVDLRIIGTVLPSSNYTVRCWRLIASLFSSKESQSSITRATNLSETNNMTVYILFRRFTRRFTVPAIGKRLIFASRMRVMMPLVFMFSIIEDCRKLSVYVFCQSKVCINLQITTF